MPFYRFKRDNTIAIASNDYLPELARLNGKFKDIAREVGTAGVSWALRNPKKRYDGVLKSYSAVSRFATDPRVKQGVQWVDKLFRKTKVESYQEQLRPLDNETSLFDSKVYNETVKDLLNQEM